MRCFQVDAFTDAAFRGNPAAVCLLDRLYDDSILQSIAAEMNLSETAFVTFGGPEIGLRWFTPAVEVDLCGHATLAAAKVLWSIEEAEGTIAFSTRSGPLAAIQRAGRVELDFPAIDFDPIETPLGLAHVLGEEPIRTFSSGQNWIAELGTSAAVRGLRPNLAALRALDVRGVMVTAAELDGSADFVSRYFAPSVGIDEDPVTGSAHCVLGPLWSARLGRRELRGYQASRRGGVVDVEVRGDRVRLLGDAVVIFAGELYIDGGFSSASQQGS